MAITRAQQFRQMLEDGGMLVKSRADGKRPGYYGPDAGHENDPGTGNTGNTGNTGGGSTNREKGIMSRGLGPKGTTGNIGDFEDTGPERDTKLEDIRQRNVFVDTFAKNLKPPSLFDRVKTIPNKMRIIGLKNKLNKFANINQIRGPLGLQVVNAFNPGNLTAEDYEDIFGDPNLDQLGMKGKDLANIDQTIDALDKAEKTGITQSEFETAFYGPDGPPEPDKDGEGGQQVYIPPRVTSDADDLEDDYYASVGGNPFKDRKAYRLFNQGGIADTVVGGEFDFESARQMYGLGKLVKKVTRTVKKIAKSPVGKAALLYAGGSYLSGFGALKGLPGAGFFKPQAIGLKNFFMGKPLGFKDLGQVARGPSFLERLGIGKAGLGIIGASALAGLMTKGSEEDDEEEQYRGEKLDIAGIRRDPYAFIPRRFAAEGGDIEKEPVAKKTMPLLDMGGKEMDLREEGGFVPIGRMEKADDVPARLSKNEFVFTADAVRNAGDGDVDLGAEKMYNMMKSLEAGGDVSEESQGLEGARKMFQTSQRLEEVI